MNTKNDCNMHELLMSYLYDEATPRQRHNVENHLQTCDGCKSELEAFGRVRGMLQQWQLDDVPVLRVSAPSDDRRSFFGALKELFLVSPLWAKAAGAVAMAMLVLAVLGTDVSVGRGGVSLHADLLRRDRAENNSARIANETNDERGNIEHIRSDVKSFVNQLIAESERQQKEQLKAELISLQSQLENMHSADLAKISTRIQEQRARIKNIEQDIDRREGLDLTDILFSEVAKPAERSTSGGD